MTGCHIFGKGGAKMPTDTFFNLPQEKQQRILEAAQKEFSRAALNEASIANVVKDAGIARGSFYQYFENKEDLYYYYFHTVRKDSHRYLVQAIQESQGNVFDGIELFFVHLIPEIFSGEHALFYKNLFTTMDYHGFKRVAPTIEKREQPRVYGKETDHHKEHQALLDVIDESKLKITSRHELNMLLQMLMHIGFNSVTEGYRYEVNGQFDIDQAVANFRCKLAWLKNGAGKEIDK